MRITGTPLFKSIVEKNKTIGKKITQKQLAKQLAILKVSGVTVRWDKCLIQAFIWGASPQGHKFWSHIDGW